MIILKPEAGLCNRLRSISSAISVARKTSQRLVVFWQTDYAMDALFSDFFEKPKDFSLIEMRVPRTRLMRGIFKHLNAFLFKTRPPFQYSFRYEEDFVLRCQSLRKHKGIVILSSFLAFTDERDYDWLKLKPGIAAEIDKLSDLSRGRIGVHIRRTDNKDAMAASPLEGFYERIDTDIAANAEQTYFLATDDNDVKEYLRSRHPYSIFTRDNIASRSEIGGVRDAVIDLWLLSQSSRLYGSKTSSFSEEASRIGHIDVEWICGR